MLMPSSTSEPKPSMSRSLTGKRLYIAHLAQKLEAMEASPAVDAVAYRLFAKRMRSAMAGYPEALLATQLGRIYISVAEALEHRHFEVHGVLPDDRDGRVRRVAATLLRRLTRSTA